MKLSHVAIKKLKLWNQRYPSNIYDGKYLKKLAVDIFGLECLSKSSALGSRSRSTGVQRLRLDTIKLKFIQGIFLLSYCLCVFSGRQSIINSTFRYTFPDLFSQRTGNDNDRTRRFNSIMTKHCGNARR